VAKVSLSSQISAVETAMRHADRAVGSKLSTLHTEQLAGVRNTLLWVRAHEADFRAVADAKKAGAK